MYRESVKANICTILHRTFDGESAAVGSGCMIRTRDEKTSLKVATSKKLIPRQAEQEGKLYASFVNPTDQQWDLELGNLGKEYQNSEIGIFPFERNDIDPGIDTAYLDGIPVVTSNPASLNQSNFDEDCRILVRSSSNTIVQFLFVDGRLESTSHEPIIIDNLKSCAEYNLAVQGAPVIFGLDKTAEKHEFRGTVDFNEDGRPYLIPFVYTESGSSQRYVVHTQETQAATLGQTENDTRLLPDDFLETLWENQYFCDDLSKALDLTHLPDSQVQDHRHLAHQFNIPKSVRQEISGSEISPTEKMLEYLQSTRPDFVVKELCENLKKIEAFQPLRIIQKAIKEGKLQEGDLVSELADKDLDLKNQLIIQIDAGGFWKGIANRLEIPSKKWSAFLRDSKYNPTRNFFEILRTQSPQLKMSTFKSHLTDLKEVDMLQGLSCISDEALLRDLTSEASLMCDVIEPRLNTTENQLLYKLAERFQKQGYLIEVDIEMFHASKCEGSPTVKLMEYILACKEEQFKIQDLWTRLVKIKRIDCCDILKKYVKGFDDVDQLGQDVRTKLQLCAEPVKVSVEREFSVNENEQKDQN